MFRVGSQCAIGASLASVCKMGLVPGSQAPWQRPRGMWVGGSQSQACGAGQQKDWESLGHGHPGLLCSVFGPGRGHGGTCRLLPLGSLHGGKIGMRGWGGAGSPDFWAFCEVIIL